MLTEEKKSQIIAKILGKLPELKCPMCQQRSFTLVDGYITQNIQNDYKSIVIGSGKILPLTTIVCNHCGYIAQFALGGLGLIEESQEVPVRVINVQEISDSDKEQELSEASSVNE